MQMFSVENYTMDRAERCTQRKEPYNRYLQEADAVRRTVPVSATWRIPHNDYCRGLVRLSTHRLFSSSWGKGGKIPQGR